LTERPGSPPGLFSWALFHSPSLEETGIRGVLLDIGGIACSAVFTSAFVFAISLLISPLSSVPLWLRLAGGQGRHFFVT